MLFRRTETRSTLDIAEVIDSIGGQVNGFTDREGMYLYARTLGENVQPALELLLDQLLHSVCAEKDVAREREVVRQEIAHLRDVPEDWIHELVPQTVWPEHPLGRPLLGTEASVATIGREALLARMSDVRAADRMIVSAVGHVDHEQVVELTGCLTADLRPGRQRPAVPCPPFRVGERLERRPGAQVHFCLVAPGCARTEGARHKYAVLDALLGGGSSSRLFQEIRENRGLVYGIGSYLQPYRETGLFVIDAGTAPGNLRPVLTLIDDELQRLRQEPPAEPEVERAKAQLRVSVALAAESTSFRMQHLAMSELHWGRVLPFEEMMAPLDEVTAEDVHELAQLVFEEERRSLVAIGPFDEEGGSQ